MSETIRRVQKIYTDNKSKFEIAQFILVIIASLGVFASVLAHAVAWSKYDNIIAFIMLVTMIASIAVSMIGGKKKDFVLIALIVLYFAARFLSYRLNGISINYGGSFMTQMFYMIGVSSALYGSRLARRSVLLSFALFDAVVLAKNWYNYIFWHDSINVFILEMREKNPTWVMENRTNLFMNPNHAGMMAGAAAIVCFALAADRKMKPALRIAVLVIGIANIVMLMMTGSRSSQTGVIVTAVACILVRIFRKKENAGRVIGVTIIAFSLTVLPIIALVHSGSADTLKDNRIEEIIEDASSGRYAFWKVFLRSQKGHMLLGYGNNRTAVDKRIEYVNSFDPADVPERYAFTTTVRWGQHNGFIATVNETGWIGYILLILILLWKAGSIRERLSDGNWEYLLIVFIMWVNLFESKLITVMFFTGYLLMVLLAGTGSAAEIDTEEDTYIGRRYKKQ